MACAAFLLLGTQAGYMLWQPAGGGAAWAQAVRQVSGRVVDAQGNPLSGATVVLKGSTEGITTDSNGAFKLPVTGESRTLVISYIGMGAQEVAIGNQTALGNITLTDNNQVLSEVVVTALGIERSAKTLSYSVQKIGGEQINEVRDANFTNTLSGKIAGLTITPSANGPGGATRIVLRGNRSIQGSNTR